MNFKVKNLATGASLVTNQAGFDGLIASHIAKMDTMTGALESKLIRAAVNDGGWESQSRGMRIEQTTLPVNHAPVVN